MDDDLSYLKNYKTNHLYTIPAKDGAYAKLVGDTEVVIGEVEVTERSRLAVSAFYVNGRANFDTLKLTKLKYHKKRDWLPDGSITINRFQAEQMKEFISILSSLDLRDVKRTRISLENVHLGALGTLLSSEQGGLLVRKLAESPELHNDIYALAAKQAALGQFGAMLNDDISESRWQAFFERNPWIFGHGLNYVFLNQASEKLEAVTTGHAFDRAGKRVDALMRTRAAVSQYVLIEIKKSNTELLKRRPYRAGCWAVSEEVSDAVTQAQKTVFEFKRDRFRDYGTDELGNDTGLSIYAVEPRSYLVIGNLEEIKNNDDKITCFELYRRNVRAPEIVTFDELFERARCIVANLRREEPDVIW